MLTAWIRSSVADFLWFASPSVPGHEVGDHAPTEIPPLGHMALPPVASLGLSSALHTDEFPKLEKSDVSCPSATLRLGLGVGY